MGPTLLVFLLVCAFTGGAVGWMYGTRNLYRRPRSKWLTDEIPKERISRRLLARRKRERLQYTLTCALMVPIAMYVGWHVLEFAVAALLPTHG